MKDKTIENVFVLAKDPTQGCEELSVLCYWKDVKMAKSKCKKWFKCGMLKETKDLSGLKLFWAVQIDAGQKDIQHSTQDNIWMMDKIGNHLMYFLMNDVCSNTLIERIAKTYLRIDFNFEDPIMAELSTQKEDTTLLSTTIPTGNVIIFRFSRNILNI